MTIPHIPNMYIACDLPAAMLIPKSPWLFQCQVMIIQDGWMITGVTTMTWETSTPRAEHDRLSFFRMDTKNDTGFSSVLLVAFFGPQSGSSVWLHFLRTVWLLVWWPWFERKKPKKLQALGWRGRKRWVTGWFGWEIPEENHMDNLW